MTSAMVATSGGQISQSQLFIDAALCSFWSKLWATELEDGPLYLWADSSPQCGSDWFMSLLLGIRLADVSKCVRAVKHLLSTVGEIQQADVCAARRADLAQLRHESGEVLTSCMQIHRQIPMGLGSGSADVQHKVRCMVQKLFVESPSLPATKRLLCRLRGCCVDMGTELSMPDLSCLSITELIPPWMSEAAPFQEGEDDNMADGSGMISGFAFPLCMLSAGSVHICNNMAKDIDTQLPGFAQWKEGFVCLVHLIHHGWLRNRIVGRLMLHTSREPLKYLLDHGCPMHAVWKWGSVAECVRCLLKLRKLLPSIWDPNKFLESENGGGDQGIDKDTKSKLNIPVLTRTIQSDAWWAYAAMIDLLHSCVGRLTKWCESCPCHDWLRVCDRVRRDHWPRSIVQLEQCRDTLGYGSGNGDGAKFQCPMRGKRAPELARGAVLDIVRQIAQESRVALLETVGALQESDLDNILQDYDVGRCCLEEIAKVKFGFWNHLPWVLASLADSCEEGARGQAINILQQFSSMPQHEALHHRITWFWLGPGSALRGELQSFAGGERLHHLPLLNKYVSEFWFIPTAERIQEAEHSLVKRFVGHRKVVGPIYQFVDSFSGSPMGLQRRAALQSFARAVHAEGQALGAVLGLA